MTYTITPSADGKYIIVKVSGETTSQSAMKQNIEAHVLGKKLGISRYLVDATAARNLNTVTQDYLLAHEDMMKTTDVDRNARGAILVSPEDHSHDFIETMSKNAGLDTKHLRDHELAIQHLQKG